MKKSFAAIIRIRGKQAITMMTASEKLHTSNVEFFQINTLTFKLYDFKVSYN